MHILKVILVAVCWIISLLNAQQSLDERLTILTTNFAGTVGIYVEHLVSGEKFGLNQDSLFPTASMIKVPILLKLFQEIEDGQIGYRDKYVWRPEHVNYPYEGGILYSSQEGKKITINELAALMITYSDNHASLWLQKISGGGEQINTWLENNGYRGTRINSRTEGREPDRQKYGWGQTTPREMVLLLKGIRQKTFVSAAASDEMYRLLCNIYWKGEALSQIPPEIQAASKQGAVNQSRSEVVLVNAPGGDYVFCVVTKNQEDTSWGQNNAGFVLLRSVSAALWKYFEPGSDWEPVVGSRYYLNE